MKPRLKKTAGSGHRFAKLSPVYGCHFLVLNSEHICTWSIGDRRGSVKFPCSLALHRDNVWIEQWINRDVSPQNIFLGSLAARRRESEGIFIRKLELMEKIGA